MTKVGERFANDREGFEAVFARACVANLGGNRQRGIMERAFSKVGRALKRVGEVFAGGAERVAVRRGVEWARGGWVHMAPNDVWRFDTGGGKRILGIAGEVGKETKVLILSWGVAGDRAAFRELGGGVAVLRVRNWDEGERMAGRALEAARGWIFVNPLQYGRWAEMRAERRVVYDVHDEFVLSYARFGMGKEQLMAAEQRLLEDSDQVWFCTEADRTATQRRYPELDGSGWAILPNGIHAADAENASVPSEARAHRTQAGWSRPVVLFAGANYGPNYEAVDAISRDWAPAQPGATFVILGMRLDRYLRDGGLAPAPNVVFTGLVSEAEKRVLYDLAEVAIMPIKRGTGSSLKVPEAIARGKVVIATRVGLRGFEEWTKWESVIMTEGGAKALEGVLGRLETGPEAYDATCRGAANEMQRRYTWGALMERWRGTWMGKCPREKRPSMGCFPPGSIHHNIEH